jgi:hypothetical protein
VIETEEHPAFTQGEPRSPIESGTKKIGWAAPFELAASLPDT